MIHAIDMEMRAIDALQIKLMHPCGRSLTGINRGGKHGISVTLINKRYILAANVLNFSVSSITKSTGIILKICCN